MYKKYSHTSKIHFRFSAFSYFKTLHTSRLLSKQKTDRQPARHYDNRVTARFPETIPGECLDLNILFICMLWPILFTAIGTSRDRLFNIRACVCICNTQYSSTYECLYVCLCGRLFATLLKRRESVESTFVLYVNVRIKIGI